MHYIRIHYKNQSFYKLDNLDANRVINTCHNPYFNRWFSAIEIKAIVSLYMILVTILILIDGFLQ